MLIKRYKLIIALAGLPFVTACNTTNNNEPIKQEKFRRSKWFEKDDMDYSSRDPILKDLITNHQLKGLTYKQLVDSLGEPANYGDTKDSIYYDIVINYGYLDPKSGKYLVLNLDKDSVVNSFKVVQWHNRHVNEN